MIIGALHAWVGGSLQRRLNITLAVVLAVVSALFLGLLAQVYERQITEEHARASLQINGLLQAALENAMLKRDLEGLRGILGQLADAPNIAAVRILNPDFEVRFASSPALEQGLLNNPQTRAALAERQPQTLLIPDAPGGAVLRSVNPVANQAPCQQCHGPLADHPVNGLLVVDYRADGIEAELWRGIGFLALAGLAVIVVSAGAIWAVLRHAVLRPLGRLQAGTAALAEGALSHRLAITGRDEVAQLGRSFNAMAAQVEASVQALGAAEAALQAVIDAIPDGIRVIGPDFRILKANAAYARQIGQPQAAVLGQRCHASSHGRSTACPDTLVTCPLIELRGGKGALTCRQVHLDARQREVHVEVAAAPVVLMLGGQPTTCVVEAIRDLEQQARLSQEHRLSELGLMASGVAHEIHNPLSSVSLVVAALRADLAAGDYAALPPQLDIIGQEVERTLAITDSMLMLCQPPSPEPLLLELDRVIPSALALLTFQAQKTGAAIDCKVQPGVRVMAAESDVRMLISNLVMNALHAMTGGGVVKVRAHGQGAQVILQVEDTGHGIAPRDLDRIFLPFWTRRADGTSGRGLGLSIVQSIVDRSKGRIAVESTVDVGSRFTIFLPNPDADFPNEGAPP